jgi:hypothetical protein
MRLSKPRLFAGSVFAAGLALSWMSTAQDAGATKRWYKGNLHTHTLNSDGDSTPHEVATWYREHGYQFLILSDHNYLTDVTGLNSIHAARDKFLLIPGEEVTDRFETKPIHVNAYNLASLVTPQHGDSVVSTIQNNVNAIRSVRALPSLNHPNFGWAVTIEDMLKLKGLGLFEVYNGHPQVNNAGGGGAPSLEEMWDAALTAGQRLYGIAVDDAHTFKIFGKGYSNPGQGWVQVRADSLSSASIAAALEKGEFYATTGVTLSSVEVSTSEYRIRTAPGSWEKTNTFFIGDGGKVLAKSTEPVAAYKLTGSEKYVRARVESSSGERAWTQPVFR